MVQFARITMVTQNIGITNCDIPEGTRDVPIIDVDCPRLEHLAPPGSGWPTCIHTQKQKKTSAQGMFFLRLGKKHILLESVHQY